ncbi:nuclear transport factor 2 family protein [Sphingosinicella rhizophila]|uniref:Nuclear transport factor 2 family protein n=1 Tax=Sphingosinicella rhizophila TaxID=3050082 RepID=A0ABU3QAZ1_9SPHN|nr:nuclear transport factor 2 family protein [Sphingosinicella sp. GR2756]MDT9600539.1 nuclear transport factor 2 family protein [Sphingosinicella sp. GR2756]
MPLGSDDELAILRLLNMYAQCGSRQDADGLANLFTEDGVWERKEGAQQGKYTERIKIEGREAWRAFALEMFEVQGSTGYQYVAANAVVTGEGDRAEGVSTAIILGMSNEAASIILIGNFEDEYRRTRDGWKFAYRGMRVSF